MRGVFSLEKKASYISQKENIAHIHDKPQLGNPHKENKPIRSQTSEIRFGNVTYIVNTHYKENGRETAKQKLLRYVTKRISAEIKSGKMPENQGKIHSS